MLYYAVPSRAMLCYANELPLNSNVTLTYFFPLPIKLTVPN